MKIAYIAACSFAALLLAGAPSFAQTVVPPGVDGTAPTTRGSGVGPDSLATGYSVQGRGGEGGIGGGPTTNGTSAGAGTLTGGTPGGYPDRH